MKRINLTGITDNQLAPVCARLLNRTPGQALILCPSLTRAKRIASDLAFFTDRSIFVLPELDVAALRYEAKSRTELDSELAALRALCEDDGAIIVAPVLGALRKIAPRDVFLRRARTVKPGDIIDRADLVAALSEMGYERSYSAEACGQFAVRGDIVDVFVPGAGMPVRIEFFDDEVDSLRMYDPATQRSAQTPDFISIYPAQLVVRGPEENARAAAAVEDALKDVPDRRDYLLDCINSGINDQYLEGFV